MKIFNKRTFSAAAMVWGVLFAVVVLSSALVPLAFQAEQHDMTGCMVPTKSGMECAMALTDYMAHLSFKVVRDDAAATSNSVFMGIVFIAALLFLLRTSHLSGSYVSRYLKEHPNIPILLYLNRAFSGGILHPRIYA